MTNPALVAHLRALGKGEIQPLDKHQGICFEVLVRFGPERQRIKALFSSWPKFSGCQKWPVPHPECDAVFAAVSSNNLWADDDYGNNRRELCLWLADQLEVEG
jgi:hypothetical protein